MIKFNFDKPVLLSDIAKCESDEIKIVRIITCEKDDEETFYGTWNLRSFSEITEFFDKGGTEYKLFGVSHVNNMLVFFVSDYLNE